MRQKNIKNIRNEKGQQGTDLSFELLSLFVHTCAVSFVLVVIYRPEPASAVTDDIFDDFADVLERTYGGQFNGLLWPFW